MDDWQEVADLHMESMILTELAIGHLNEVIIYLKNVLLNLDLALENHGEVKHEVG